MWFDKVSSAFEQQTNCDRTGVDHGALAPSRPVASPAANALESDLARLVQRPPVSGPSDSLLPYLRIHPPGIAGGGDTKLDRERAPLLLSIERHRRIPIDWNVIADEDDRQPRTLDLLRERVEAIWLATSGYPDAVPVSAYLSLAEKSLLFDLNDFQLVTVRPRSLRDSGDPRDALTVTQLAGQPVIVADRPDRQEGVRYFALYADQPNFDVLSAPIPWNRVARAIEAFPKKDGNGFGEGDHKGDAISASLADRVRLFFAAGNRDVTSLLGVSSDVPVPSLRARLQRNWRFHIASDVIGDLLDSVVIDARRDDETGSKESYWRQSDEGRRAAVETSKGPVVLATDNITRTPERDSLVRFPGDAETEPGSTWVFKVGARRYAVIFRSDLAPGDIPHDLTDFNAYDAAWDDQISHLESLAWSPSGETEPRHIPFGYIENVDLSPQLILEEFARLKIDYDVANATSTLADNMLSALATAVDAGVEHVRDRVSHARELKGTKFAAERSMRALAERARKLQYVLATGLTTNGVPDNQVQVPTGPNTTRTKTVEVGKLYQFVQKVASFKVRESTLRTQWGFGAFGPSDILRGNLIVPTPFNLGPVHFGFGRRKKRRDRLVNVDVRYQDLEEAKIDIEPWQVLHDKLTAAGMNVLVTELTADGYCLPDGTPLREIMTRCAFDEGYREKLAVFVPIFQESLSQGLIKVRYAVAIRPEQGDEPDGFPRIYCQEQLSYRAEWVGTELGELLQSVSLAPGEERKVMLSRTIERKAETVESISTVLDVTRSTKEDLASSIENTIRNEKTTKSSSNWNANASASFGPFSGGGGGGGSKDKSVTEFAETIKKQAMTTTKEMRTNQRQEVRSSTTTTTSVNTAESTESIFKNINHGSTLNIVFFKVNNVFRAGFFLDALQLTYQPSVELIAGTGIRDSLTFKLKDLPTLARLTCVDPALATGDALFDRSALERRILRAALATLFADYLGVDDSGKSFVSDATTGRRTKDPSVWQTALEQAAGVVRLTGELGELLAETMNMISGDLLDFDAPEVECDRAARLLDRVRFTNQPFDPHILVVPSAAVYSDSLLGALPATEPYSERMREAEIRLRYAEIGNQVATSALKNRLCIVEHVAFATADIASDGRSIEIRCAFELPAADWIVLCDGTIVGSGRLIAPADRLRVVLQAPDALKDPDAHVWSLTSPQTQNVIALRL
jgi:hypothetical protein